MMSKLKGFNVERLRRYERFAIRTVLIVAALGCLAAFVFGGESFVEALARVPLGALVALTLAGVHENIVRIYRYKPFMAALNIRVPWSKMVLYYVAGMAFLPTPGKIGVLARPWLLHYHHGVPFRRGMPLIIMDTITDLLAMMALIALGVFTLGKVKGAMFSLTVLGGMLGAIILVFAWPSMMIYLIKTLYRAFGKRGKRFFATIITMVKLIHTVMGWRVLVGCTLLSFFAWLGFGLGISYVLRDMGYMVDWNVGNLALSVGTVVGILSLLPAGAGGAEASMAGIIYMFNVPWADALVVTLIARLFTTWLPVLAGFIALPFALKKAD